MGVNKDQLKRFFKIDDKIKNGKKATIIQLATAWNNSCRDEVEKVTERTIANDIKAANTPGKVIPINIHTGGYATPSGSEPDYRTAEGNAIAAISTMGITGYPTGSMNRHVYTGTAITMSRGVWAQYATQTLAQSSYVNVA